MEPASPGPVVVIADCPSAAYLPSLVASPALARCMGGAHGAQAPNGAGAPPGDASSRGAGDPGAAACVIHLAPAEVRPWLCTSPLTEEPHASKGHLLSFFLLFVEVWKQVSPAQRAVSSTWRPQR